MDFALHADDRRAMVKNQLLRRGIRRRAEAFQRVREWFIPRSFEAEATPTTPSPSIAGRRSVSPTSSG